MSLPVVLRPEATQDAAEAIGYFDALRPGLGQAFLIQVQDVLLRISGMPELHGIVWRNVRAARLRRFTYVVDGSRSARNLTGMGVEAGIGLALLAAQL